ncbi:hypothetical protein ACFX12_025622 [Malus domestica]
MLNSSDPKERENEVTVLEDEELFTSSTDECSMESEDECAWKINLCVITRAKSLILDLIDRLEDPLEKIEVLEKYLDIAKEKKRLEPSVRQPVEAYSFKTIVDRIAEKIAKREPTLVEIQHEINTTKEEIKGLKDRVQVLELYQF